MRRQLRERHARHANGSPSAGWTFDGWSGEGCSGTGTCTVTMSQARSVTATFSEQTFPLNVAVTGNGVVTANAGAISCGNGDTFCADVYGAGTLVTLTATPASGQTLLSWLGACSGNAATCVVTMDQARAVTATFSGTASYPLDVGIGGSGYRHRDLERRRHQLRRHLQRDLLERHARHADRHRFRRLGLQRVVRRLLRDEHHLRGHDEPGP